MALGLGTDVQQIGGNSTGGTVLKGANRDIISGVGATRTLLAKESGALCLFDRAAGVVYTLPTPVAGMQFEFATTVTITSNAAKVITAASTQYLLGMVQVVGGTTETTVSADFNGTTHVAISMNGTTTGGVIGDRFLVTAISTTQWVISGIASGSGTVATPAATS